MPAIGETPGIRRPVRTMTVPSIPSRISRLGLPTSSAPSGVIVAAFRPRPVSRIRAAASVQTSLPVARRFSSERSKRSSSTGMPRTSGSRTAQRCLEQLLAGLVALEDDDAEWIGHRASI